MTNIFCNKRYDISFSDFYKLINLCLPSDYTIRQTRGLYKTDYQPCNIIAIKQKDTITEAEKQIYCWLGQKGLTVLADTELTISLCTEVLKNVKQNPEDYKVLTFDLIDKDKLINHKDLANDYIIYEQINSSDSTNKYLIKEYNGDEVQLDFYYEPDYIRLSGATNSLFIFIQLLIEKLSNKSK